LRSLLFILSFSFATSTLAKTAPLVLKLSPPIVTIEMVKDSKNPTRCQELLDAVKWQIESRKRFTFDGKNSEFKLMIACSTNKGSGVLYTQGDPPTKIGAAVAPLPPSGDVKPAAWQLTNDLLDSLPFEGEVVEAKPPKKEPMLSKPTKSYDVQIARLSIGRLGNKFIGPCLPIEVGTFTDEFKVLARGVVFDIKDFESFAEVRFSRKRSKGKTKLLFRFSSPLAVTKLEKGRVEKCKDHLGDISQGTFFATHIDNASLNAELIELNSVRQRFGSYLFNYSANNGQAISSGILGYAHNEFTIGEYFELDARVARHLLSNNWSPGVKGGDSSSEMTIAEGFLNGRFTISDNEFKLGAGFLLEKINVPHVLNDAGVMVRPAQIHGALLFKYNRDWPSFVDWLGPMWSGFRLGVSPSQNGAYTSVNIDHNIMITSTWFAGTDLYLTHFANSSSGLPGGRLIGIGGHVGFSIERDR
jgi:hypothetical protein